MDADKKELLRQLFTVATEFSEAAHDLASTGQSGHLAPQEYGNLASQLRTAARNMTVLADAAAVIAENSTE